MEKLRFVAATNNPGKLREIREILASIGAECLSLKEAGIVCDAEETGKTFAQNAYIKAKAVFDLCGLPTIADDSGLCVDALDGGPGVYTARYAGPECDSEKNIDKLLGALDGLKETSERRARFVSAVCALFPDGRTVRACGVVEGYIGFERLGGGGFGYDPIFRLPDDIGFAELTEERKNAISHRGRAIRKLAFKLRGIKRLRGLEFDK